MPQIVEAKEGAVLGIVAGLGGDGDVLVRVGIEGGVLRGRFGRRRLVVGGISERDEEGSRQQESEAWHGCDHLVIGVIAVIA